MVGEIRDLETADIAIKAAQTGHLVLSTLHTNDAPTTLTRLLNMGVAPFNIASSVILITAQRLARQLCENCKTPADYPARGAAQGGLQGRTTSTAPGSRTAPVGCSACNNGYKGRVGIYQVMPITEEIQRIILRDGTALDIAEQAQKEGVRDLRQSGLIKVQAGPDVARRSDRGHQRIATRSRSRSLATMATAAAAQRETSRNIVFEWEGKDQQRQDRARRDARRRRSHGQRQPAPPGHPASSRSRSAACAAARSIKQKDIAIFTRQLATMMKAGVPLLQSFDIVGRGSTNPQLTQAADRHPHRRRDRHQPVGGVPQAPAVLRRAVLQPGRGRRSGRYPGSAARPPGDLQGKDARDQEQDQVGAVLPDRGDRGRLRRARGDHDLRDPGVQGRVQVLRRRPAGADADRDGDVGVLRHVLVADLRRPRRRRLLLHAVVEALA